MAEPKQPPLIQGRPRKKRSAYGRGVSAVGKTTRQLYAAHEAARSGEHVRIDCASRIRCFHLLQRLRSIGFGCKVQFEDSGRTIKYPSGGVLRLTSPEDRKLTT